MKKNTFFLRVIILVTMQAILVTPIFADQSTEDQLVRFNCAQKYLMDAQKQLEEAETLLDEVIDKHQLSLAAIKYFEAMAPNLLQEDAGEAGVVSRQKKDMLKEIADEVYETIDLDIMVSSAVVGFCQDSVRYWKEIVEAAKKEVEDATPVLK